ncbi:DUF4115 domain-containing protein [Methylobacillus arboreus]|uniref:RodZ domain-containing protein n=1 Tax=Methylobacillus arboreus TaxID=755170 RepID=UPI001E4A7900|nr:RodZ domain-containing protein [Methylobacillus arboreus]MCB5189683.1 DUF4115 domain-containing protein [Methylobacillus arboreus]
MSEQNYPDQELQAAPAYIDRIGPVLIAARENLRLTVDDVSNRLRLSLRQVHALESDDFAVLPEAVITRGFIRNYARLLGIDAAPLLHVYSQYVPVQDNQAISIPSANIVISGEAGTSWRPYVWVGGLLVLLLCAWILYVDFFQKHDPEAGLADTSVSEFLNGENILSDSASIDSAVAPEPVLPASSEAPTTTAQLAEPIAAADTPPASEAAAAPAPAQAANIANQALPEGEGARLKFSVSEATWVSISDGSGKQILNKTLAASSEEIIDGKPPFRVVVGNANGTKLEYNNRPVDLIPYIKVNVARLTLE